MLKKPLTAFFSVLLLNCAALAYGQTNSVTLTSFYPQPIGAYARLRIIPQNPLTTACANGEIYFGTSDQKLYLCSGNIWNSLSGFWETQPVTNLGGWNPTTLVDQVYLSNTYPNLSTRKPWVGIGTQNPQSTLHVTTDIPAVAEAVTIDNLNPNLGNPGPGTNLCFFGPLGGSPHKAYVAFRPYWTNMTAGAANTRILLYLRFRGSLVEQFSFTGQGFMGVNHFSTNPSDSILVINRGPTGPVHNLPNLSISTNANPANTGNILNVLANGNIGINTPAPTERLEVTGNIRAAMLILTSDAALKKNISPIKNALKHLSQINGVSYHWKNPASLDMDRNHLGIIAQDAEKTFPEIVYGQNGRKAVDYPALISSLIEAIKELKNENEFLNEQFQGQSLQIQKHQQKINALQNSFVSKEMLSKSRSN